MKLSRVAGALGAEVTNFDVGAALANGEDGVVTARFTLLPNAAGAGDFTVLSIYSY